jgi:hypothetical protein
MDIKPKLGTTDMAQTLRSGDTVRMPETDVHAGGRPSGTSESHMADIENRVRSLVGDTRATSPAAHRTTVHGPLPRNNHR